mgnify:FL=1
MAFADIHCHLLCGVDDGAKNENEMFAIADAAYRSGTRLLCCTPHFHPGYFGENYERVNAAFARMSDYAKEKHPDLALYLGNELRYGPECTAWLREGVCRTMNGTRYVLVDFSEAAPEKVIGNGLHTLLNAGYIPILAHVERYRSLHGKIPAIRSLWHNGVIFQADTQSLFRKFGLLVQSQCKKLLSLGMIDMISSDAHNCTSRPPEMTGCFHYISKKYGADCAAALCCNNAERLLRGEPIRKDFS